MKCVVKKYGDALELQWYSFNGKEYKPEIMHFDLDLPLGVFVVGNKITLPGQTHKLEIFDVTIDVETSEVIISVYS